MQSVPMAMWEEYRKARSPELRQKIAARYLNLVHLVVTKFRPAISTAGTLDARDLEQMGAIGLLDAIERFDPGKGTKFETYAVIRIRGTIQDELRKLDWVPRSMRKQTRDTEQAETRRFDRESHVLVNHSTAAGGGTVEATMDDPRSTEPVSADIDPLEEADRNQLRAMLGQFIADLPEQDRLIVTLYYFEELTFREIGVILRLSESRVSQKHASIMRKLRVQFGE